MAKRKTKGDWGAVMMDSAGIVAGSFATNLVATGIKKVMPKANDKIIAIAPVAVGIWLAKTQSGFLKFVGYGLIGSGASTALRSFGIGNAPISQEADDIEQVLAILQNQQAAMNQGDEYADMTGAPIQGATEYDEMGLAA